MTPEQNDAETIAAQYMIIRRYRELYGPLPEPVEADEAFDHLCRCAEGAGHAPEVERLPVPEAVRVVVGSVVVLWTAIGALVWWVFS